MKKLIFKKFYLDHALFFLYVAFSITLIVWVIQAVNFLDIVSEDGHSFRVYFFYSLLNLPKILSRILPFIFFISLFYIIVKYENYNELIVFWTIGIKKIKFINEVVKLSLFYILLQLVLTSYIVPTSQDLARSFIRSSQLEFLPSLFKEKKFIDTVHGLTILIGKKNKDGTFNDIFLKDQINERESQIIFSKNGSILSDQNNKNYLELNNGKIINNNGEKSTVVSFKKTSFNLSNYTTKTTTFPKIQEVSTKILFSCIISLTNFNIIKIDNKIFDKYFSCNEESSKMMKQELFKRLLLPFYLPLLSLIASFIIINSKDSFNYRRFQFFLFFIGTSIIIFSEVSVRYTSMSNFLILFFSCMPIIFFITFYLFLLNKLRFLK
jgi:lipopolysaccharide export system permease protein